MRDRQELAADRPAPPDAELAYLALRYAAGELDPAETEVFELRLGVDQSARDALAEAVRLSAAASGVPDPAPDPLARVSVRERLRPNWFTRLFPRRPYRGHPLTWTGVGGSVAAAVVLGTGLFPPDPQPVVSRSSPEHQSAPSSDPFVERPHSDIPLPAIRVATNDQYPRLGQVDPLAIPKLNPMGYQEHTPYTGRILPERPQQQASSPVVPTPMPTVGPWAEVPFEPETATPAHPMAGNSKNG